MHTLYIGKNKNQYEHFNHLLDGKLFLAGNQLEARSYIFEHLYNAHHPIFIFLEHNDPARTTQTILQLRKNKISNQFILLIGEDIPQQSGIGYLQCGVNEIVDPGISRENLNYILNFLPRLTGPVTTETTINIFRLPLWKRCFDIAFAGGALLLLSPILLLTAAAIRLESPGPVIYTSQRVGSNYRIFGFLKFRSMYKDADKRLQEYKELNQYHAEDSETPDTPVAAEEKKPVNETSTVFIGDDFHLTEEEYLARRKKMQENNFVKLRNDPRITRVGRIIRKYSIDELPQLINILKGDMSIVGNRPLPLYEAEQLTSDEYIERFIAPAGLTGLWQVEKRGIEGILSPEERKQLDIQYARKFSFRLDMKIIFRTFTAFVQKENV